MRTFTKEAKQLLVERITTRRLPVGEYEKPQYLPFLAYGEKIGNSNRHQKAVVTLVRIFNMTMEHAKMVKEPDDFIELLFQAYQRFGLIDKEVEMLPVLHVLNEENVTLH